jgi:hypothetical protein
MSPNTHPLAALLSQHPEECAAVVAVLACYDALDGRSTSGIVEDAEHYSADIVLDVGEVGVICDACCSAGFAELDRWGDYSITERADRYAIARVGAAAWLRERVGVSPREARYVDREAIAARVANVLGCRLTSVRLAWESSRLGRIEVDGRGLDGDDIAALIRDGFEPSPLGWDVPADCGSGAL